MEYSVAEQPKVLVVDDTPLNVRILHDRLESNGYRVIEAQNGKQALERTKAESPDLILLDILMPVMDGYEVLEYMKSDATLRHIPIIVISAVDQQEAVVRCLELGAEDFLTKPFNAVILKARVKASLEKKGWRDQEQAYQKQLMQEIRERKRAEEKLERANESLEQRVLERTVELNTAIAKVEELKDRFQAENIYLQQEIKLVHNFEEIISQSNEFAKILASVEQVAATDATVLVLGETGTGKELLARAIHSIGARKDRPLVKVNCATLPANLIESELFGHEKGSFTGAQSRRIGRFELADGGTIFLDEVAEMPLELQAKLLRVLQEGEFERLGGSETIKIDARVIAATNRNLVEEVSAGAFREDLYYRLNVFPVCSSPLRDRREDIPLLVNHFVAKYSAKIGKKIDTVSHKALETLKTYDWPGNIRELENIIERAVITSSEGQLEVGDWFHDAVATTGISPIGTLEEVECDHIVHVLDRTAWKIRGTHGAAEMLGLKPTTLEARMKKLGIERPTGLSSAYVHK